MASRDKRPRRPKARRRHRRPAPPKLEAGSSRRQVELSCVLCGSFEHDPTVCPTRRKVAARPATSNTLDSDANDSSLRVVLGALGASALLLAFLPKQDRAVILRHLLVAWQEGAPGDLQQILQDKIDEMGAR